MNVRLVVLLSLLGLVIGFASVAGFLQSGAETGSYCILAVVCATLIARLVPSRHFLHGFLTGFLAAVLGTLVEVLFFDRFLANNPKAVEAFQRIPSDVPPRVLVILMTPIVAACLGVFTGFLAWAAFKAFGRRSAPPVAPA